MSKRNNISAVNAGSMADIAFLLLIFFLVTTVIETDTGLDRMLPKWNFEKVISVDRLEKNVLTVFIDEKGGLLVNNEIIEPNELKKIAIDFLDNGGGASFSEDYCSYCLGIGSSKLSDNPLKAVITLVSNRATEYGAYIAVQNELVAAYIHLRNRESQRLYNIDFTNMEAQYQNANTMPLVKKELKIRIQKIQALFPLNILDAEIKNNN